jgi:uncharacterized protein (DUF1499 family)
MKPGMCCLRNIKFWRVAAIFLAVSSTPAARGLAVGDMRCPDSPNCVSSLARDARHFVDPFTFQDKPAAAMQRLRQALLTEKRVTIVEDQPAYLHAEVRSLLFRFVDDIEFTLQPDQGLIQVRSAARTGHSDFGVNRRRIERIRRIFQE